MKTPGPNPPLLPNIPANARPIADAISDLASEDSIKARIHTIRGVQVMLDRDLAALFGVGTKALNQAVKRNPGRFPERFMFQTTEQEAADLRSQIVTSSWGGRRYSPFAFTEHGVIMLASVLRSETAIAVSLRIVEAFVAMRKALASITPLLTRIHLLHPGAPLNPFRAPPSLPSPDMAHCALRIPLGAHGEADGLGTGIPLRVFRNPTGLPGADRGVGCSCVFRFPPCIKASNP